MLSLFCGRDIFVAYEKRISCDPQADELSRQMHRDTHICINRCCYEIFYNYINVHLVVFIFRSMEVSMK